MRILKSRAMLSEFSCINYEFTFKDMIGKSAITYILYPNMNVTVPSCNVQFLAKEMIFWSRAQATVKEKLQSLHHFKTV